MGSLLGPLLAYIFMALLEEDLTPKSKSRFCNWKQYVDDTDAYVEPANIEFVLNKLNNYHLNINFTSELEKKNEITFLDLLIKRLYSNKQKSHWLQISATKLLGN